MASHTMPCPGCSGSGYVPCSTCSGSGGRQTWEACKMCFNPDRVWTGLSTPTYHAGYGLSPVSMQCLTCGGTKHCKEWRPCSTCDGAGTSRAKCAMCSGKGTLQGPLDKSFYTCGNVPQNGPGTQKWISAQEVRDQVANAPAPSRRQRYPSGYQNHESLPLRAPAPYLHIPAIPGRSTTHTTSTNQGAYRATYNDNDRETFDVMYHDRSAGTSGGGHGLFRQGDYHPAGSGSQYIRRAPNNPLWNSALRRRYNTSADIGPCSRDWFAKR